MSTKSDILQGDYIVELIKCCFVSEAILRICQKHLKYQYLDTPEEKKLVKYLFSKTELDGRLPSWGVLSEVFKNEKEVISLLAKVKAVNVTDVKEQIIAELETFIKNNRLVIASHKVSELFNEDRKDEAIEFLAKESAEIASFSLKNQSYVKVLDGFEARQERNAAERAASGAFISKNTEPLIWGIAALDKICGPKGGPRRGSLGCYMGRSGGGKTTAMRWTAFKNTQLGRRVVHFSKEGGEDETVRAYETLWSGLDLDSQPLDFLDPAKRKKVLDTYKKIKMNGGDIIVYATDSFDGLNLTDCRAVLEDIVQQEGPVDMIVWDYLELFNVRAGGGNVKSEGMERKRREDVANAMVNICKEFNAFGLTATQSQDVTPVQRRDPKFVLTRSHISEFKGAVKPLSYFLTINQTFEEEDEGLGRLYFDKYRFGKSGQVIPICHALDIGRFVNTAKTLQLFNNDYIKGSDILMFQEEPKKERASGDGRVIKKVRKQVPEDEVEG